MQVFKEDDFSELELKHILQSVFWFIMHRNDGVKKQDAIRAFYKTRLCRRHGEGLTFHDIDRFADFAYCE